MLLERLKCETRPHHVRVESLFGLPTSLDEHRTRLLALRGFLQPWEAAGSAMAGTWSTEFDRRRKVGWIESDLLSLGFTSTALVTAPVCRRLPSVTSFPELMGSWYVVEGSTLGGQLLARNAEQVLGLRDLRGYRFYHGYGSETGAEWQRFRGLLSAQEKVADNDAVVESARSTFACLGDWFETFKAAA